MNQPIRNSTILITGGTGSFGHRVALRLLTLDPKKVIIFSRDEKKQYEMRLEYPQFGYVLGDVRNQASIEDAMRGVDIVFHAAALKQVPNCESWPMEAVATNVLGSNNVFRAACRAGVKTVIALSTDKAVKPVNAMGITKAMMEKVVTHFGATSTGTVFACVRYGNVLGSRGSVIPVFRAQIQRGGPVTVTVPHMTRFLLTLDDAVGLVFYAMENAIGGEVFVRKAPACTMDLMAKALVSQYAEGRAIETKIIGMRVGEKLHEVLVNEYEMLRARDEGEFYVIPPQVDVDGSVLPTDPNSFPEYTSDNTTQITRIEDVISLLRTAETYVEAPV